MTASDKPSVYLLHFERPYRHARHYLGQAKAMNIRLAAHNGQHAARLLQVLREHGITWELARVWECETWEEARQLERRLKGQKHGPRLCPICNPS